MWNCLLLALGLVALAIADEPEPTSDDAGDEPTEESAEQSTEDPKPEDPIPTVMTEALSAEQAGDRLIHNERELDRMSERLAKKVAKKAERDAKKAAK